MTNVELPGTRRPVRVSRPGPTYPTPDHELDRMDRMDDLREASASRRDSRALAGRDRVARLGAASLTRGGMHATVVDPSFGDNHRRLRSTLASGHHLDIDPPAPDPGGRHQAETSTQTWRATINPPTTDHRVGGEEIASTDLGVLHPRELHSKVQAFLSHPDTMRAMGQHSDALVGQMQEQQRSSARRPALEHLGAQFGSTPRP